MFNKYNKCSKCGKSLYTDGFSGRIRPHTCVTEETPAAPYVNGLEITSITYDEFSNSTLNDYSDNSSSIPDTSSDIGGGGDFGGAGSSNDF